MKPSPPKPNAMPSLPTTVIREDAHALRLQPPLPELETRLVAPGVTAEHLADGTVRVTRVRTPLVETGPGDKAAWVLCGAGHRPLVEAALAAAGRTIVDVTPAYPELPPPDRARVVDPAVVDFVAGHRRGLIRFDPRSRVSLARLVTQLATAWPDLRIASSRLRSGPRRTCGPGSPGSTSRRG